MTAPGTKLTAALGGLLALAACDVAVGLERIGPPRNDLGPSGQRDGGPTILENIIAAGEIRDDFDSKLFMDPALSVGASIDTNRGVALLPSTTFPALKTTGVETLGPNADYQGVVEAGSILIGQDTVIDAKDSVELRATDILRVSGLIRAGEGGVTLISGKEIHVDGVVESQGPIRLKVASEQGVLEVRGRLRTLASQVSPSQTIRLTTRGSILVSGELRTDQSIDQDSGGIELVAYGSVSIAGPETVIITGPSLGKQAGRILISTESGVEIDEGARILAGMLPEGTEAPIASAGSGRIEIRAVGQVRLGAQTRLVGGESSHGAGGSVLVVAESITADGASLEAGHGSTGGEVQLEAQTITLSTETGLAGGSGDRGGGDLILSTAGDLQLRSAAHLLAGAASCGEGGSVLLSVAGSLEVEEGVLLKGGAALGDGCLESYGGGDVAIIAQDGNESVLAGASSGGFGSPPGEVSIELAREYTRPAPDVRVRTEGWIVSKIFDRGAENRGKVPVLREVQALTPQGTFAKIQLAGASSPEAAFEEWTDADKDRPGLLGKLADSRYFRYRIWLKGRALDSPEVDFFEIDLTP